MLKAQYLKAAVILLFNVMFIILASRWFILHVDFKSILNEFYTIDQHSIYRALILGVVLYLFYGFRLALLLDLELLKGIQIVVMGFGLNALFPFRLGDLFKILFSKQFFKVDLTQSSFATVIEKGFDLIIIGSIALFFVAGGIKTFAITVISIGLIYLIYILLNSGAISQIPQIKIFKINQIIVKCSAILSKSKLKGLIASTLAIWVLTGYLFFTFFDLNIGSSEHFGVYDALALMVMTTLSLSIPSMPASLGVFESGIVYYLSNTFHFTPEKAVSYALIFHLVMIIPQVITTLFILLINSIELCSKKELVHEST